MLGGSRSLDVELETPLIKTGVEKQDKIKKKMKKKKAKIRGFRSAGRYADVRRRQSRSINEMVLTGDMRGIAQVCQRAML